MLRLTFVLCSGLFLALLIGGRDFGQLRPGLARAAVKAKTEVVAPVVPVVETVLLQPVATVPLAVAAVVPEPAVAVATTDPVLKTTETAGVTPALIPASEESTVFTLQNYIDPVVIPTPEEIAAAEPVAEGEIWYVAGDSLNVRAGPSTEDAVVGRLTRGEAALVVWRDGSDWARIRIEGDGIEGYVAARFLSAEAPRFD